MRRGGVLVNVGSAAGLTNVPLQPTYNASKAAQHSLTQASRALLAGRGVTVHGVYPRPVDTDMTKDLPPQFEKTPPEDVANEVLDGVEAGTEDIFPDPFVYRGITGGTYTAGTPHGRTYRGAITFENTVGAFAELNSVLAVFELDIDDAGKVSFRTWELV